MARYTTSRHPSEEKENLMNHLEADPSESPQQDSVGLDIGIDAIDIVHPEPARDAGFVISEGLAYAVLFVGVMVAAAAAFTGLAERVVTQIQSLLGI
jgi:hypothetical protein